jgi:hypothetical protein
LEAEMIRSLLLLAAVPVGAIAAQNAPIQVTISAPNRGEFRVTHMPNDLALGPVFGRGRLEFATGCGVARGPNDAETMEIVALDTLSTVHVEATRDGHVIASGDGAYVMVRHADSGIAIEARSTAPASVIRTLPRRE